MATIFSVDVSISTSSTVWDLATAKEFTVTLELLLPPHVDAPITFRNAHASLSDPTRRENDQYGLFYKDLSCGVVLPLGRVQVCTVGAQGSSSSSLPLQKGVNEEQFTTLYPGKPHQILLTRRPQRYGPDLKLHGGRFQRNQEDINRESGLAEVWRWPFTHQIRDGVTYECGISDKAVISEWWKGSKEEIAAARCAGSWPEDENQVVPAKREVIRYNVVKTAQFLVRRNDSSDLRLSWP